MSWYGSTFRHFNTLEQRWKNDREWLPGRTNIKACLQAVRLGSESTMSEAEPEKELTEKAYFDARPSIKTRLQLLWMQVRRICVEESSVQRFALIRCQDGWHTFCYEKRHLRFKLNTAYYRCVICVTGGVLKVGLLLQNRASRIWSNFKLMASGPLNKLGVSTWM